MIAWTYMWWFWLMFVLFFLLPTGYGWGYRGWGAPFPRFVQRRRMQRATVGGAVPAYDHQAWGRGGDFIWGLMMFELVFVVLLLFWR